MQQIGKVCERHLSSFCCASCSSAENEGQWTHSSNITEGLLHLQPVPYSEDSYENLHSMETIITITC